MSERFRIRVDRMDGKTPLLEVMHNGVKIDEISYLELVELVTQAASVFRYFPHGTRVRD